MTDIIIRKATAADADAIWAVIEPVLRSGEAYALDREISRENALLYWMGYTPGQPEKPEHETWVAVSPDGVVGTYYLRPNNPGGGAHVCNSSFMVAEHARRQGIATLMLAHALERARERGFYAMQFNFVVAANEKALRLWLSEGFTIVGRLPGAYRHPRLGLVDALVLYRTL